MTGFSKNTVTKLLVDLGEACWEWHDEHVRGLDTQRDQVDEIRAFAGAKQKGVERGKAGHS